MLSIVNGPPANEVELVLLGEATLDNFQWEFFSVVPVKDELDLETEISSQVVEHRTVKAHGVDHEVVILRKVILAPQIQYWLVTSTPRSDGQGFREQAGPVNSLSPITPAEAEKEALRVFREILEHPEERLSPPT
jgi:hypothetical protein